MTKYGGLAPEYKNFPDRGCEFHTSCLSCPLKKCFHDMTDSEQRWFRRRDRDKAIVRAVQEGQDKEKIAEQYGICERTVERILERQ